MRCAVVVVIVALFGLACAPVAADGDAGEGEGDAAEGEGDEGEGDASEGEGEGDDDVDGALFFAPGLHTVDIVVDDALLEQLDNDLENRVPCTFTYDGETIVGAGIRKKGQSTLRPLDEKASFSVKLDETVDGADIDGVQKFALNNTIMDTTFLSEPLSYLLYERAGVPAPRSAHAVVRFNGETKGIYVVVEGVNKRFLKSHYGDGEGNLYEGPWDFTQDVGIADLKDEDEGRSRDDLIALTDVVNNASDATLKVELAAHMDVDQVMKTVALDMAFCLWDGYAIAAWNFYLYDVPSTSPDIAAGRFVMLPHGADWPYWEAEINPFNVDFRPWGAEFPAGFLAVRMTQAMPDEYAAALDDVRENAFDTTALLARVDETVTTLHEADANDPVLAAEVATFDDTVQSARDFILDRRAFLDAL